MEIIEPGDARADVFGAQLSGQVLVVVAQAFDIGSVVIGNDDGIVVDTHVSVEPLEQGAGEVGCIPLGDRGQEATAQPMDDALGYERHGHLPVADIG